MSLKPSALWSDHDYRDRADDTRAVVGLPAVSATNTRLETAFGKGPEDRVVSKDPSWP
jgi:hypothetical protein